MLLGPKWPVAYDFLDLICALCVSNCVFRVGCHRHSGTAAMGHARSRRPQHSRIKGKDAGNNCVTFFSSSMLLLESFDVVHKMLDKLLALSEYSNNGMCAITRAH